LDEHVNARRFQSMTKVVIKASLYNMFVPVRMYMDRRSTRQYVICAKELNGTFRDPT